jgi:ferredoxin
MKAKIDPNICIGCGTCESLCGQCFKLDGNVAKVIKDDCGKGCNLEEVAQSCPVGAISIEK